MKRIFFYQLVNFIFLFLISVIYTSCKKDNEVPQPPSEPSGLFPADRATDISTSLTLSWVKSKADGGFVSFDVYFGTSAEKLETVSTNLPITTFVLSGLAANTTYYWKVVARDKNYLTTSGQVLSFTTKYIMLKGTVFNPDLQYGSVNDIDGNSYKTIRIGTQTWMAENLKTTKLNDGTHIPLIKDVSDWQKQSSSGYCWYNNDEATYRSVYGALYNGFTVATDKLCPTGWHMPTDAEWTNLITYLGGESYAAAKLRESGTNHWSEGSAEASNESGFSSVPAGAREAYNGTFQGNGTNVGYGSFSKTRYGDSYNLISLYYNNRIYRTNQVDFRHGSYIRCCKDSPPSEPSAPSPANGATDVSASPLLGWTCSDPDGDDLRYDIFLGITGNPTTVISSDQSYIHFGARLATSTTYYWKVIAKDIRGTITEGPVWSFTTSSEIQAEPDPVSDIDGNFYKTVRLGTQVWMAENLKTTRYKDGMAIPLVTEKSEWSGTKSPGFCWFNNDEEASKNRYGALYNLYTINTGKICPDGWHVPAKSEWTKLLDHLVTYGYNYDGSLSGYKVAKALASSTGWASSYIQGAIGNTDYPAKVNASGFSALPGGYRNVNGYYLYSGSYGYWWLSDKSYFGDFYYLENSYSEVLNSFSNKNNGMSVRCVKD